MWLQRMYLQLLAVAGIILVAVLYLARQMWRALRGNSSGCGGGCAKCASTPATSGETADAITSRMPLQQLQLRKL